MSEKKPGMMRNCVGGCLLLVVGGFVLTAVMKGRSGTPDGGSTGSSAEAMPTSTKIDKMWFLSAEPRGTNGLRLEFGVTEDTDYKAVADGELVVSLRPWTGAGTDDEIARITTGVTTANFEMNDMGSPMFKADLTFEPNRPMPPATSWLQVEVTITPKGGKGVSDTTKVIHQNVVYGGAPSGTGGSEASGSTGTNLQDISVISENPNQAGRFRAKFMELGGQTDQGMLVVLDSVASPNQKKGVAALMPERLLNRLEASGDTVRLIRDKPNVIVELEAGTAGLPTIRSLRVE